MTDLIKAADALAETADEYAEGNATLERLDAALHAYRQARESADGVKVARKAMELMLEGIRKGGLDTEMGHHLIDDIFYPAIDSYIKAALED